MIIRENAVHNILTQAKDALVICCNGRISRELFETRILREEPNDDFCMVGSMGCALAIALGAAINTKREVYCILGDGNLLMKLGTIATYLKLKPSNLHVFVLNNNSHDSTGGQPTAMREIKPFLPFLNIIEVEGPTRLDLGRPTISPVEMKERFMKKANVDTLSNPLST